MSCHRVDDESASGGILKNRERCLVVSEVELVALEVNGAVQSAQSS